MKPQQSQSRPVYRRRPGSEPEIIWRPIGVKVILRRILLGFFILLVLAIMAYTLWDNFENFF